MDEPRRLEIPATDSASAWLTPDFLRFFKGLHDAFHARVDAARANRTGQLDGALNGTPLGPLPESDATRTAWSVEPLPEDLRKPGIEISGPISITSMAINALNPGPDGARAVGYLDDDEDSGGHQLADTLQAVANRCGAFDGTLDFEDEAKGKRYRLEPGALPFFVHRERGWHLDEPGVTIDAQPVSATLLGTALTLFHVGQRHARVGRSIHFYLPKMESADEARLYADVLAHCESALPHLQGSVPIRGIALVESLPAVWQMEEILHALGPYGAGLNAARWDLKASLLEFAMNDAEQVWPDRFGVDIKSTPFLSNIFRRLVAVCGKHGAVPIGGMATALPSKDAEINKIAAESIHADKAWEAREGFVRGWVAHIHHMSTAAAPFEERWRNGFDPDALPRDPDAFPIEIVRPEGEITEDGTRRNLRTLLEYVEGWLRGRGAVAIDSMASRPGKRPALMEDLATARTSVAQTAQRILHGTKSEDTGRAHAHGLVSDLLGEELSSIRALLDAPTREQLDRYERARAVTEAWIDRYTALDFRSLGSIPREDLGVK